MDRPVRNIPSLVCYTLLVWVTLTLQRCQCQDKSDKFCFGGKEDSPPVNVTLTCGSGKVISLGEVWMGRNQYGLCTYVDGDCKDESNVLDTCKGRETCTIAVVKAYSPECGYATFLRVSYDCQTAVITRPISTAVSTTTGKPDTSVGSRYTGNSPQRTAPGGENREEDNAGLIAGCVIAVVVTVILLIVAIVLVVRRLACAPEDGEDDEEKKASGCHVLPCVGVNSAGDGTKAPRNDNTDPDSSQDGDNASTNKPRKRKNHARRADKNQNMSARLAPVGQEDVEAGASSNARAPSLHGSEGPSRPSSVVDEPSSAKSKGVGGGGLSHREGSSSHGRGGSFHGGGLSHGRGGSSHGEGGSSHGGGKESGGKGQLQNRRSSGEFVRRSGEFVRDRDTGSSGNVSQAKAKRPTKTMPADVDDKGISGKVAMATNVATKQPQKFDAMAVPNTETTTSC